MKTRNDLESLLAAIEPADRETMTRAQARLDRLTKPRGSLGRLEELAARTCAIRRDLAARVDRKVIFTFAADHGVTAEGVSGFPQEVTAQMVANFLAGGAGVNVLARHVGAPESVVTKPATAELWAGQTDEGELGMDYDTLDAVLALAVDGPFPPAAAARLIEGVTVEEVERVRALHGGSEHKRRVPPAPEPLW